MKKRVYVFVLLLSFIMFSCSKNDNNQLQSKGSLLALSQVNNIELIDVKTDTVWQSADTMRYHFDTPQKLLDVGDLYKNVLDSISFDFQNLNDSFSFNKKVYLPGFWLSDGMLLNSKDSILVDGFPIRKGFYAKSRFVSKNKFEGSITNLQIIPKYQRIYVHGKAKLSIVYNESFTRTIIADFKGSMIGSLYLQSKVWD